MSNNVSCMNSQAATMQNKDTKSSNTPSLTKARTIESIFVQAASKRSLVKKTMK